MNDHNQISLKNLVKLHHKKIAAEVTAVFNSKSKSISNYTMLQKLIKLGKTTEDKILVLLRG